MLSYLFKTHNIPNRAIMYCFKVQKYGIFVRYENNSNRIEKLFLSYYNKRH